MEVLFLGGNARQQFANDYLCKYGIKSRILIDINLDNEFDKLIDGADVIILPLPTTKDGINLNIASNISIYELLKRMSNGQLIIGGKIPIDVYSQSDFKNRTIIDLFADESFVIQNALLSAEGAIYYAKEKTNRSIHGSRVAIFGFGRIGKLLAYLLYSQGAKISVFTRKELDRTWSKIFGFDTHKIENIDNHQGEIYDLVFNTIPFHIINEEFLRSVSEESVIIDVASYPYGIDEALIKKHNLNYYIEPAIPGRYAPQSAGEIIAVSIINYLTQEKYI